MSWIFPVVQSIHLVGIALFVGTIIIGDLRILGYALRRYAVADISDRFAPWTRAGLAIMLTTGPVLFASDITRYSSNPAFLVKMAILAVALVFRFTVQRRERWVAIISIALWTCVVLAGRAIADFDV